MALKSGKVIPLKYEILREVVREYPGLLSTTESLLRKLSEPKNWRPIIREVRPYALKNFPLHDHHEKGLEAIKVIVNIFLEAIESPDVSAQEEAIDSLIFYLDKILTDVENHLRMYEPLLHDCFSRLYQLKEGPFFFLTTNPHQLKKLGERLLGKASSDFDFEVFKNLFLRYLSTTYEYWLRKRDPFTWFEGFILTEEEQEELRALFHPLSHDNLKALVAHMQSLRESTNSYQALTELLTLPGYMQIVRYYEDVIGTLTRTSAVHRNITLKMVYLLRLMETEGLSSIHENVLREMNRTIFTIVTIQEPGQLKEILSETIGVLKRWLTSYPETALTCMQSIGNEIFNRGDSNLVEWFIQKVISVGFQYPKIEGATDEWEVRFNKAHLKNMRVWLELIEKNPKWSKSLMSALIINLRLGGVQINDTDLFQKDITKLLNSDIKPVYHLVKQMAKLFPVYFGEINAEGELRDVSTEIDEVTARADPLIHFLRKQSHVESSARIVDFIEEIMRFWRSKDKRPLEKFLPEEIFHQIRTSGPSVDDINTILNFICNDMGIHDVTGLLGLSEEEVKTLVENVPLVSEREKRRALLAIKFYQLLNRKYRLDSQDVRTLLRHAQSIGLPGADSLVSLLDGGDTVQCLGGILDYLQLLKDIILSPERYEAVEDIFRKRHIAAGIPSVSGRYHERKFDALSLTFRLENLANTLFEKLIDSLNLRFITRATLFEIKKSVNLFFKALHLDGISSTKMENALELLSGALEVRRFSFSQYIDIFRGFSEAVQDILNSYYTGIHKNNLKMIILQMGTENIQPKYLEPYHDESEFEFINKVSERFLREVVATSFVLQQLDTFISRVLKTILSQEEDLDVQNLDLLMSYEPRKAISNIYTPHTATDDRIHLGNKGYNLVRLASLGMPIPPGFIITTEVFRCREAIKKFVSAREHLDEEIKEQLIRLEKITGKRFGNSENPLIVSVRSGGAIPMPGMMNSFLNVGLNEYTVMGLIKQTHKPWFAWDCYRRFLQCWGMSFGMERNEFDDIINSFKRKYRVVKKINFTPEQMREVALAYRETIRDRGIEITDVPETQLSIAIEQVFNSWFSRKAEAYREILGISEHWGTAVIVQAMIYGNLDTNSGTGVLFTRNPQESGDRVMLWGDFAIGSQGEDVVSGLVRTLPLSNEQKIAEDRKPEVSLEDRFPEIYNSLLKIIKHLIYKERWGAQEIEFTFEGKSIENLYILQARDMAITKRESIMAFIPSPELSSSYLSSGIGVGGGALSGRAVFDLDDMKEFRAKDPSTPLILIRSDTVPDDIRHISSADGLLTARGGSTCHAAIIANRLGKTCVVGCNKLLVWEYEKKCRLGRQTIKAGDFISIDGRNGSVYSGSHHVKELRLLA